MSLHYFVVIFFVLLFSGTTESSVRANDCWLSPQGTGLKNGTNADNAYPPQQTQKCFKQTGPDGTLHVLEGKYSTMDGSFLN